MSGNDGRSRSVGCRGELCPPAMVIVAVAFCAFPLDGKDRLNSSRSNRAMIRSLVDEGSPVRSCELARYRCGFRIERAVNMN